MHILISYKDNPKFSLYTTSFGRKCTTLERKNHIGFNGQGREQYYTNSPGVEHILIQNCSADLFRNVVTDELIKYRIVEDNELTKVALMVGGSTLQLDVGKVLAKNTLDLQVSTIQKPFPAL